MEPESSKSKAPIVAALICGLMVGTRALTKGAPGDKAFIYGVVAFLFWWVVLAVVFRLVRPKTQGGRVGLAIMIVVGVPAGALAAIGILLLVGPSIGLVLNPTSAPFAPRSLVVASTFTPIPTPNSYPTTPPASQVPWWQRSLDTAANPATAPSHPRSTNTASPVMRQLSPTLPAQPKPKLPTPTGRDESYNQTVTAIDNWIATAEANATIAAYNGAAIPTPAVCRGNVSISTPRHASTVKGLVDILGTATLPGFQFYKLEYSLKSQPAADEWIAIGKPHNQPVANEQLGTWDTSSLPAGQLWLRLVVVDQTGNYPEPCRVLVIVSK